MMPNRARFFVVGQRGGRLVEHDDLRREHEGPGRSPPSASWRSTAADPSYRGRSRTAGGRGSPPCRRAASSSRTRFGSAPRQAAEEDVLGDRHLRHQRQFLVDQDDAGGAWHRSGWRPRSPGRRGTIRPSSARWCRQAPSFSVDLPARVSPPQQRMDLARPNGRKVTRSSAVTAGKRLVNAVQDQHRLRAAAGPGDRTSRVMPASAGCPGGPAGR